MSQVAIPELESAYLPQPKPRKRASAPQPKKQPPYAVVVFNDHEHSFELVVETFSKVFGYAKEKSFALVLQIHNEGRGIVWSGAREVAELKRDQVRSCGPDFYASKKVNFPLAAMIEPLPG